MRVNLILPVHNRKDITLSFISDLKKQSFKNIHLILVDDGSSDGTADSVKREFPSTTVLRGDGNLWWAGALELARRWLVKNVNNTDEIVMIINDDVSIKENYIEKSLQELGDNKNTLYFTPSYSMQTDKMVEEGVEYNYKDLSFVNVKEAEKVNCLSTRGLFFRIEDFNKIGPFYPKILPHYLSDYEYTIRAGQKGYQMIVSQINFLYVNEETTGIHDLLNMPIMKYFKYYFSKRFSGNPFYYFVFILLRNPGIYKLIGIYKVTRGTLGQFKNYLKHKLKKRLGMLT